MKIERFETREELGREAGQQGALWIKEAIAKKGAANIILATGQSQFETIEELIRDKDIDWSKVRMFHLDEYIGLSIEHKASFRKYLSERFIDKVGSLLDATLINGEADPIEECRRIGQKIINHPIDVAFVGIGENGHLAFNDPPADLNIENPYLVVNLDQQCRQQQMSEGWFATIDDVPLQAISMSIRQIMKSSKIICAVPDERKAKAVKMCLSEPVSNLHPSSILQEHNACVVYLDKGSASLLS